MRWTDGRRSDNVEDERGMPAGAMVVGGGIGTLVLALVVMFLGGDPVAFLNQVKQNAPPQAAPGDAEGKRPVDPEQDRLVDFVQVILADTEDVWTELIPTVANRSYEKPKLKLFTDGTQSGCGFANAAVGPFYCPADHKVYLDLEFFQELRNKFKAPGDFAQAYVIAHEVGHHVQDLLGTLPEFNQRRQSMSQDQANAYSVRIELQADCYAGAWGKGEFEKGFLDSTDVSEAITAANQIGDDTLTRGSVSPRQYTHGTSAQRMKWFKQGYTTGDPAQCDTFTGTP
jgi:predicted metalloprotease